MDPLISIIIPTYNYGKFISECFDELIKQTYTNWECIVVDDGSIDNTKEVVESYIKKDPRFSYIKQPNLHQSAARNNGLKYARGEFIQFLDADDKLAINKFENQIAIFKKNPELDIVYSNVRFFEDKNPDKLLYSMDGENKPWMTQFTGKGRDLLEYIIKGNVMVINSPLFKKSVIDRVGNFNLSNYGYNEDWEFWLRCAFANMNFYYDDNIDSIAIVRSHGASSSKKTAKMYRSGTIIRDEINEMLTKYKNNIDFDKYFIINKELRRNTILGLIKYLKIDKDYTDAIFTAIKYSVKDKSLSYLKYVFLGK